MDEAHYIKSPKAQRSVAAARIAKDTAKVILLTGTPVINRPIELFNLLKTLDPTQWSNFWAFVNRYCGAKQTRFGWDFSGATNLEELHQITRTCVIRRTKQQVLTELPEKQQATVVVEFDKLQRSAYRAVLHETEVAIEEREPGAYLAQIEKLKQAAVLGKLPAAIDWIADFVEAEKLVVFCTHTMVVDALMQRFGKQAVKLTGSDSQKQRQAAVDSFQNDDSVRLFVGNIKAAGVGITLTAASNVAFLEFGWTPGEHSQAADRVHRIGQRNAVTVWWLITEETIEGDIVSLLESKRQVVDKVTDGEVGDFDLSIMDKLVRKIKSGSSRDENTNTV
jgi:SWI/SNF-related matrix-associated actin-dependent regulator 1 of chromatin subfamily A